MSYPPLCRSGETSVALPSTFERGDHEQDDRYATDDRAGAYSSSLRERTRGAERRLCPAAGDVYADDPHHPPHVLAGDHRRAQNGSHSGERDQTEARLQSPAEIAEQSRCDDAPAEACA